MPRIVEVRGDFKILATHRDYVVINTALEYENHAHFKSIGTLQQLLRLIDNGLMPTSPYMIKAAKRLLGNSYDALTPKRKKASYYNRSYRNSM